MNETGDEQFDDLYVAKVIQIVRQKELEAILRGGQDAEDRLSKV